MAEQKKNPFISEFRAALIGHRAGFMPPHPRITAEMKQGDDFSVRDLFQFSVVWKTVMTCTKDSYHFALRSAEERLAMDMYGPLMERLYDLRESVIDGDHQKACIQITEIVEGCRRGWHD